MVSLTGQKAVNGYEFFLQGTFFFDTRKNGGGFQSYICT